MIIDELAIYKNEKMDSADFAIDNFHEYFRIKRIIEGEAEHYKKSHWTDIGRLEISRRLSEVAIEYLLSIDSDEYANTIQLLIMYNNLCTAQLNEYRSIPDVEDCYNSVVVHFRKILDEFYK